MRIVDTNQAGNTNPAQTSRTNGTRAVNPAGTKGSGSSVSPSGDSVQLSGLSGRVSEGLETQAATRAQRVNRIAAAVQSGTYKVDSKAISRALIDQAISGGPNPGEAPGSSGHNGGLK